MRISEIAILVALLGGCGHYRKHESAATQERAGSRESIASRAAIAATTKTMGKTTVRRHYKAKDGTPVTEEWISEVASVADSASVATSTRTVVTESVKTASSSVKEEPSRWPWWAGGGVLLACGLGLLAWRRR